MSFIHLIAERSVGVWLPYFIGEENETAYIVPSCSAFSNEMAEFLRTVLISSGDATYFIHSGHASFQRDLKLADLLVANNRQVVTASSCAVQYALDKIAMKKLFFTKEVATPPSLEPGQQEPKPPLQSTGWVVKAKNGTAGSGMAYYPAGTLGNAPIDMVAEQFIDGEEYSVNIFSLNGK